MTDNDFKLIETWAGKGKTHSRTTISRSISNMIAGEHDLSVLNPNDKAQFVFGFYKLMKAMEEVGWVEHTSDWDWAFWVELKDGTVVGDYMGRDPDAEEPEVYCDNFEIEFDESSFNSANLTDDFYNELLTIEIHLWGSKDGTEEPTKQVKLGDIKSLTFMER
jgi:hypothetical protein